MTGGPGYGRTLRAFQSDFESDLAGFSPKRDENHGVFPQNLGCISGSGRKEEALKKQEASYQISSNFQLGCLKNQFHLRYLGTRYLIPPIGKEIHLPNCLWMGYLSCREGIYLMIWWILAIQVANDSTYTSHVEETFLHILNREAHLKVSKVCFGQFVVFLGYPPGN